MFTREQRRNERAKLRKELSTKFDANRPLYYLDKLRDLTPDEFVQVCEDSKDMILAGYRSGAMSRFYVSQLAQSIADPDWRVYTVEVSEDLQDALGALRRTLWSITSPTNRAA